MREQKPIQSGFSAASSATEVIKDRDLSGKTVLITGGYSGLGLEASKAFSAAGARVIVTARNRHKAQEALQGVANVTLVDMDLASPDSVKRAADNLLQQDITFDWLLCNAGIMACPEARTGEGWESQFATNHLGHYVLVNMLWPKINQGGRVVCVASAGHHNSAIRWDDIHFHHGYDKWLAYGQSKTANILFALQLDEYGKDRDIRAFSLHPGKIFTPLQRHLALTEMADAGWIDAEGNPIDPSFKTPEQGAATAVWAATSPDLKGLGGLYCEDCDITGMATDYTEPFVGVCAYAVDSNEAQKLWQYSAELTGINAFQ